MRFTRGQAGGFEIGNAQGDVMSALHRINLPVAEQEVDPQFGIERHEICDGPAGSRRRGGRAKLDWRYLPGVPARGMSTLSEKGPRRLQAARQRRLDRAHVAPAVGCFAGKENRPTIDS
jgi:hypothetical protein